MCKVRGLYVENVVAEELARAVADEIAHPLLQEVGCLLVFAWHSFEFRYLRSACFSLASFSSAPRRLS